MIQHIYKKFVACSMWHSSRGKRFERKCAHGRRGGLFSEFNYKCFNEICSRTQRRAAQRSPAQRHGTNWLLFCTDGCCCCCFSVLSSEQICRRNTISTLLIVASTSPPAAATLVHLSPTNATWHVGEMVSFARVHREIPVRVIIVIIIIIANARRSFRRAVCVDK